MSMGAAEASQIMNGTELTALEIFEYYKPCLKGSQPGWMSESDLKQYTEESDERTCNFGRVRAHVLGFHMDWHGLVENKRLYNLKFKGLPFQLQIFDNE